MLCTVIPAVDPLEALSLARSSPTRCIEVRADFMESPELGVEAVGALSSRGYMVVATLRLESEGGLYGGEPREALSFAKAALRAGASMVDLGVDVLKAYGAPRGGRVLASIHSEHIDGEVASSALSALRIRGVEYVKVVGGSGGEDLAAAVDLVLKGGGRVSAFLPGRGPLSVLSRALAEVLGAPIVYGVHDSVQSRLDAAPPIGSILRVLRQSRG